MALLRCHAGASGAYSDGVIWRYKAKAPVRALFKHIRSDIRR